MATLNAACDECRERKLRCSGEATGCTRCMEDRVTCHYSEQRRKGRPRKRQCTDFDSMIQLLESNQGATARIILEPETTGHVFGNQDSVYLDCEGISGHAFHASDFIFTRAMDPANVAEWPDFSGSRTSDPLIRGNCIRQSFFQSLEIANQVKGTLSPGLDAGYTIPTNSPSIASCRCLHSLFVALSDLSTMSSLPFATQTVGALESAHHTAKSVIYCALCPRLESTGSSILPLTCALLNTITSQWRRLSTLSSEEIRGGFSIQEATEMKPMTLEEEHEWRIYAHKLIRAYMFADESIPAVPGELEASHNATPNPLRTVEYALLSLIEALKRRQRQWHGLEEPTDEFVDRAYAQENVSDEQQMGTSHDRHDKHMCLEIVKSVEWAAKQLENAFSVKPP